MFLGTYKHNLDSKKRLTIPSTIRNQLGKTVVISKGFDGSLNLRTPEEFKIYSEKLLALSQTKLNTRIITRQLLANAAEIDIDNANRVLIPSNLLIEASIDTNVTIIGLGNKLELWNTSKYEKLKNDSDGILEEIAESIDNESF